jgi:hypothetical protein
MASALSWRRRNATASTCVSEDVADCERQRSGDFVRCVSVEQ